MNRHYDDFPTDDAVALVLCYHNPMACDPFQAPSHCLEPGDYLLVPIGCYQVKFRCLLMYAWSLSSFARPGSSSFAMKPIEAEIYFLLYLVSLIESIAAVKSILWQFGALSLWFFTCSTSPSLSPLKKSNARCPTWRCFLSLGDALPAGLAVHMPSVSFLSAKVRQKKRISKCVCSSSGCKQGGSPLWKQRRS